jgi:hypothetical protein
MFQMPNDSVRIMEYLDRKRDSGNTNSTISQSETAEILSEKLGIPIGKIRHMCLTLKDLDYIEIITLWREHRYKSLPEPAKEPLDPNDILALCYVLFSKGVEFTSKKGYKMMVKLEAP